MKQAVSSSLRPELFERVAARFRVLSEPTRLALLYELEQGEASVNALADALKFSQANVSKHLSILREAGFLVRRKHKTSVYYSIADPLVRELCALMCARESEAVR